jgi:hypothetical protein
MADLKAIIKQMAEDRGLGQYWPQIEQLVQLESGWNPAARNQGTTQTPEDSVGLFQDNRMSGGLGTGYSVEQLQDPATNAGIALNKIAQVINGGGTIYDALGDWVNARNQIFSTVTAAGTQGGATMTDQTQTSDLQQRILSMIAQAEQMLNGDAAQQLAAADLLTAASRIADVFGLGGTAAATAPSPQEVAISQSTLDVALANARANIQDIGLRAAAQQFADEVSRMQEGRLEATAAQDYARAQVPAGVTTLPGTGPNSGRSQLFQEIGWNAPAALPLAAAPATSFQQAQGQALTNLPQVPNYQFNAPALPQAAPNLAGLSGFPQMAAPTQTAVSAQTATQLPATTGPDFSVYANTILQAMRALGLPIPRGVGG